MTMSTGDLQDTTSATIAATCPHPPELPSPPSSPSLSAPSVSSSVSVSSSPSSSRSTSRHHLLSPRCVSGHDHLEYSIEGTLGHHIGKNMTLPVCGRSHSAASSTASAHSQSRSPSQWHLSRYTSTAAALKWDVFKTLAWVLVASIVASIIAALQGKTRALEFVTGYIVEYSLSVDNLFVFLLIFKYFKVPRDAQETVLFWGIFGAMVLRGVMIVLGKALTKRFAWITLAFAALLIYSAIKLLLENDDDEDENLDNNRIVRFSKRLLPVYDHYMGDRFVVIEGGKLYATPLMVVLVSIELSDVVFAMDSVPAVLGISSDAVVIYASNILAVMGLRSLYFIIADAISNVRFLRQALAVVLGFIGIKMIGALLGIELDAVISLGIVVGTLAVGILLSYFYPSPPQTSPDLELAMEQLHFHENSIERPTF